MTAFDKNWEMAMGGHTDYHNQIDPEGGGEGGGKDAPSEAYTPPKGYKPSTADDRRKWNQFLDYLEKKGVGGSKDLDQRDKSLGKKLLTEYNKANPKDQVSENFIPTAQYESYLIRRKGQFPGLNEQQAKFAFGNLPANYKTKTISPVDSWLGSATSRQFYPTFERASKEGKKQFGTSFENYLQGVDLSTAQY